MQRLPCFLCVLVSGSCLVARAAEDPAPAAETRLEAAAEGVRLTYKAIDLPRGKKAEKAESETLEKLEATLETEKALRVRQTILPPGRYAVRVEVTSEGARFLVIEPEGAPREEAPEKGGAGRKPPRDGEPKAEPRDTLEKKEAPRSGDPAPAGPEKKQAAPGGKTAPERPDRIRATLKLGAGPKTSRLGVELKWVSKGTKLRFTLRAGSTLATAAVGLGE